MPWLNTNQHQKVQIVAIALLETDGVHGLADEEETEIDTRTYIVKDKLE